RRRAARGAGSRPRQVPRIECRAEHLVERIGAGTELRCVRLRVDDAAVRLQPLHQDVRAGRYVIGIDRRALGGAHAFDRNQVLDGHRQTGERAALGNRQSHQPIRVRPRPRETQGRQRVDMAIDRRDPRLERVEQVMRRDFAPLQEVDDRYGIRLDQFVVAWHGRYPLLYCDSSFDDRERSEPCRSATWPSATSRPSSIPTPIWRACATPDRWWWSMAKACSSTTARAKPISTAWRGCGAFRSAMATK